MQHIINFRWAVRWLYKEEWIIKSYCYPPSTAIVLSDKSGIGIIEPIEESGLSNAVIFNIDGSLRFRFNSQFGDASLLGFIDMFYHKGELYVLAEDSDGASKIVIDDKTGDMRKPNAD